MSRVRADLLLLLTALIWGAAFVGQATAMEHMGPLLFTGLRFGLSALVVLPFALMEHGKSGPLLGYQVRPMLAVGAIFFLASILQQFGLLATTVTNAGFLTALYVILVPAVAYLALRRAVPLIVWPAAVLSLGGTWALGGGLQGLTWGDGIMVVSAIFWALQIILIGSLASRFGRPVTLATIQFAVASLLGLAGALMFEEISLASIPLVWRELAFTGIISGGIGFTIQAVGQRYSPPADAAIIMSAEALFAALFGALILGDRLTTLGWIGCACILGAVLMVQLVPLLRKRTA